MYKNTTHTVEITAFSSEGDGIAKIDGYTVFVPFAVKGDIAEILIVKETKSYGYGKLLSVKKPSPLRTEPICPVFGKCGGCSMQSVSYDSQLEFKRKKVEDALRRIGGFTDICVTDVFASEQNCFYRNKAQYPVTYIDGEIKSGFYAPHSHRVVPSDKCVLQNERISEVSSFITQLANEMGVTAYNEKEACRFTQSASQQSLNPTKGARDKNRNFLYGEKEACHFTQSATRLNSSPTKSACDKELNFPYDEKASQGTLRHICIRSGEKEAVVTLVVTKPLACISRIADALIAKFPFIVGVVENYNNKATNTIYGERDRIIYGRPYIFDNIGEIKYKVHYKSFYQVNPYTTLPLYEKALEFAAPDKTKTVFDLYCGTGTISLFLATRAKSVIGIEIIEEAVQNAKENAAQNGIDNAFFHCGSAEIIAPRLIEQGEKANIVVLDPPRKGCDGALISAIGEMHPEKIVYVSCDCATLARDAKALTKYGYYPKQVAVFDQFPHTCHVESVALLTLSTAI